MSTAEFASEEQRESYVAALVRELAGYEQTGNDIRAKQVKAELDRVATAGKPAAKRVSKATKEDKETR